VKSSTWQKSSSKFMVSSLAWLSSDFRLLEDTAYPELTLQTCHAYVRTRFIDEHEAVCIQ
jgi:hypothetical protein